MVNALAKHTRITDCDSIVTRMFPSPPSNCMDLYAMDGKDIFNLVI